MVDCMALNLISAGAVGDMELAQDCRKRVRAVSVKNQSWFSC